MNNLECIKPRNQSVYIKFCVADDLENDEDKEKLFVNVVFKSEVILLKLIDNMLKKTSIASGLLTYGDKYYHVTCLRRYDEKNEYMIAEILDEDIPKVLNLISNPDFLVEEINENTAVSMIGNTKNDDIQ